MTAIENSSRSLRTARLAAIAAPALFTATMFASALLLFSIQPMFAKMVLPRLGGTPAVWSVAMVFFQAARLVGYAYAHLLSRRLAPRHAALVHLIVLSGAAVTLPISIAGGFETPPSSGVGLWLIWLFTASIVLPFAALSATAPLLQNWFAAGDHTRHRNPYALYAASNLGSFVSLLSYPFIIEPLLPLREQRLGWSIGFAALAILIALAGLVVAQGALRPVMAEKSRDAAPTARERLRWMIFAAIPTGLTIAVTAYISTDVAAAPFLWVMPLALYLLTFVAVFRDKPWFDSAALQKIAPIAVAPMALTLLSIIKPLWAIAILLNIFAFVVLCLFCHSELYRRRPAPVYLTEFYFWISLGGVTGGAFAGLLAPHIFNNVYEYPLLISAALLMLPGTFANGARGFVRQTWPILLAIACLIAVRVLVTGSLPHFVDLMGKAAIVMLVALMLWYRNQPARAVALVLLIFVFSAAWTPDLKRVEMLRSFFGVHQVVDSADGRFRLLMHGTTIHGVVRLRDDAGAPVAGPPEPATYYFSGSPIADGIAATRAAFERRGASFNRIAVVGLGAGGVACRRQAGENWTFYEIDETVARIARDPRLFRFLSDCAPDAPIVLGDARLTLAKSTDQYELIILDAFSSDAIPVHLLTREAFGIYRARLSPQGSLIVHISNKHLDLREIVAAAGSAESLVSYARSGTADESPERDFKSGSVVMALARTPTDLGELPRDARWRRMPTTPRVSAWTDDYSNILGAIARMQLILWHFAEY